MKVIKRLRPLKLLGVLLAISYKIILILKAISYELTFENLVGIAIHNIMVILND